MIGYGHIHRLYDGKRELGNVLTLRKIRPFTTPWPTMAAAPGLPLSAAVYQHQRI